MGIHVLGVSGSPVPNSNTDRAVKAIMKASGLEHDFVKLSDHQITFVNRKTTLVCSTRKC